MAPTNTKYAVDLSNDGVSFWHRDEDKAWQLLGKVALSSETFSDDIEALKTGYEPNSGDGKFLAQVRIPRSEVFVSQIALESLSGAAALSKTKSFLSEKTPYQAQDLIFDLENKAASKTSYVAAIAKQTITEAKEFISAYGFEAVYYTSKIDRSEFPRNPRFYDGKRPKVTPPAPPKTIKEAEVTPEATLVPTPPKVVKDTSLKPDVDQTPPPKTVKDIPAKPEIDLTTPPAPRKKATTPAKDVGSKPSGAKPKTTTEVKPIPADVPKPDEQPLSATSTTDLTSFESIRSKSLVAPNKSGKKIEPSISKATPLPPRRISIDLPKPVEKTASGAVKNPITMPQGGGAKSKTGGVLKPRYAMGIAALIIVALLYWFFTELFDGKEEIARLQETPQTEPTAIVEPAVLAPIASLDTAPTITSGGPSVTHQIPVLETLEVADAPKPLAVTKSSVSNASEEQLITQEQVAETLDEVAIADAVLQDAEPEIAPIENVTPSAEAPVVETPEVATDTTTPDVQTEVALADLVPTKNGTPGAEGITLYLGQPDITPPRREQLKISTDPLKDILPRMRSKEFEELNKSEAVIEPTPETVVATEESTTPTDDVGIATENTIVEDTELAVAEQDLLALADLTLKSKLPKTRPSSILQQAKDARNSLLTKADPELAGLKPKVRPRNLSIPQKVTEPEKVDPSEIEVAVQEAVRNIARPRARPRSLSKIAAKAKASEKAKTKAEDTSTAALTPTKAKGTSKPSANTPTGVQKEATEKSGFSKRRISLIGVYGSSSSRRALVRLPSGRFVKVKAGQRVSGWKVSAIGESSVRISKGSRNKVLRMPK